MTQPREPVPAWVRRREIASNIVAVTYFMVAVAIGVVIVYLLAHT